MLDGAGLAVVLAPAFPAEKRVVVDGQVRVDGRLADETPVARTDVPADGLERARAHGGRRCAAHGLRFLS